MLPDLTTCDASCCGEDRGDFDSPVSRAHFDGQHKRRPPAGDDYVSVCCPVCGKWDRFIRGTSRLCFHFGTEHSAVGGTSLSQLVNVQVPVDFQAGDDLP